MSDFKTGNLLDSKMQSLVNTVNCVGVMGKGIALDFKNQYPAMFRDYAERCRKGEVVPGVPYCYPEQEDTEQLSLGFPDADKSDTKLLIVNFPTKKHWRGKSKLEFIEKGLSHLKSNYRLWGVQSIAIPPLGCGNGGLYWEEVGPLIYACAQDMEIPVEIYVPAHVDPCKPWLGTRRPASVP